MASAGSSSSSQDADRDTTDSTSNSASGEVVTPSDSIVPDPSVNVSAEDIDMNIDINQEVQVGPIGEVRVEPGIIDDLNNENNNAERLNMNDDFVPRFHDAYHPEGVVIPFPPEEFLPNNDGHGISDDDSDEDGDPNENVQNDYVYDVADDDWDHAESVGTHSTDNLSISSFISLTTAWVMDRLLRTGSVAWLLRKLRRRRRPPLPPHPPAHERGENNGSGAEGDEEPPADFDHELPARHIYLGEQMEELEGRVVLEEETIMEIPIVVMNFHLIPGQILPMTVFHAVFQNAIRRCILNERIFGVVNSEHDGVWDGRTVVSRNALGTIAEIYEFQEESDIPPNQDPFEPLPAAGSNFALKAKGRQRFNVLEVRRQGDGNLMAKVRIRPELQLHSPMDHIVSNGCVRYQFPLLSASTSSQSVAVELEEEAIGLATASGGDAPTSLNVVLEHTTALEDLVTEINNRKPLRKYYSALTSWPAFVYENYDERILVERIHRKLHNELKCLTESHTTVPLDPSELSYWLAQNLTMDDSIRLQILQMDSCIQRLRFELSLLQNVSQMISCRRCMATIGDQSDIFAMSSEGPQGTYVNPNGHIHETLTVHQVREIITRGFPSTEASWFQGYSWTIAECRRCRQHLGWKFKATGRLKPKKFWGLARKSVTFKYDFSSDGGSGDKRNPLEGRSPGPGSFSTVLTTPLLPPSQEY